MSLQGKRRAGYTQVPSAKAQLDWKHNLLVSWSGQFDLLFPNNFDVFRCAVDISRLIVEKCWFTVI